MSFVYHQIRNSIKGYETMRDLSGAEVECLSRAGKLEDATLWEGVREMLPCVGSFWWGSSIKIQDAEMVQEVLNKDDVPVGAFLLHLDPSSPDKTIVVSVKADKEIVRHVVESVHYDNGQGCICFQGKGNLLSMVMRILMGAPREDCYIQPVRDFCIVCK